VELPDRHTDVQTEKYGKTQTDIDEQMDKQSDCPTIRHTHKHTHSYCEQTLCEEQ